MGNNHLQIKVMSHYLWDALNSVSPSGKIFCAGLLSWGCIPFRPRLSYVSPLVKGLFLGTGFFENRKFQLVVKFPDNLKYWELLSYSAPVEDNSYYPVMMEMEDKPMENRENCQLQQSRTYLSNYKYCSSIVSIAYEKSRRDHIA